MSHFILFCNYNVPLCEILCSNVVLINLAPGSRLSLQLVLFYFDVLSYFFTLFGLQPAPHCCKLRGGGR
jgi:hypothetical protein